MARARPGTRPRDVAIVSIAEVLGQGTAAVHSTDSPARPEQRRTTSSRIAQSAHFGIGGQPRRRPRLLTKTTANALNEIVPHQLVTVPQEASKCLGLNRRLERA